MGYFTLIKVRPHAHRDRDETRRDEKDTETETIPRLSICRVILVERFFGLGQASISLYHKFRVEVFYGLRKVIFETC